jgi:multiple sugar transport system permease protein
MHSARHATRDAVLFSAPFLVFYVIFLVFPVAFGIHLSFFNWNILSAKSFIGLKNYMEAFGDEQFRSSFAHTCQFVLLSTPSVILAGFMMALVTVRPSRLGKAAEAVFFFPYMLSMAVVGSLWAWIFQKNYGLLNQVLNQLGLRSVGWLTDPKLAMHSITVATVWWTAGFNMILFSAGMKQIPDEIYDSARMDGAGRLATLTKITIPLLKDTTLLVVILQLIASFKVFGQSYVMTSGGPYGKTRVLVQYIYQTGFNYYRLGYASAMSILLFLVILVISAAQFYANRNEAK